MLDDNQNTLEPIEMFPVETEELMNFVENETQLSIFLKSGVKLVNCTILKFDGAVIVVQYADRNKGGHTRQMIYKSALATLSPE